MRYEKVGEDHHIYLEEGETEQQVLRAIVKASFELARPAGLGWMNFKEDTMMSDVMADRCISLPPGFGDLVIDMDYIQGRQCKTFVKKVAEGHYRLLNRSYECDRGAAEPMLDRAKEILKGAEPAKITSTAYMYQGASLDARLKEYGFTRNNGESDWEFRKRVFPDLYEMDKDRALEFLMGASAAEWDDMDKFLVLAFATEKRSDRHSLIRFATGFAADPVEMRKR